MMKIAQVAPLYESVPPKLYGGTERVVSTLTEALIQNGHDVTLFASGDSRTSAELVPVCPEALRLAKIKDPYADHILQLAMVYDRAAEFDVIHSHVDYFTFPFAARSPTPTVTTLHGRLDMPELQGIHQYYRDLPLVSISNSQQAPFPFSNFIGTVYHGLALEQVQFYSKPGTYLAFLGRISPEKRPDMAIAIARKAGIPLKIAAKVGESDRAYFEAVIKPLIVPPHIEFIGEINDQEKNLFLGEALALLFPIDWPEPFGLAMIESLACGTPVIARPCGSVSEILVQGKTGFIHSQMDQLVQAAQKIDKISRKDCRKHVEDHFSAETMANGYERIYKKMIAGWKEPSSAGQLADAA
jgi:glycosyltransferase involved in cell wall biosynthesis